MKGEAAVPIPGVPISVFGTAGTDWRGKSPTWGAGIKIRF